MGKFRTVVFCLILVFAAGACTTTAKRSNMALLSGNEPVADLAVALSDLKRSQSLQVLEVKGEETAASSKPKEKPVHYTVGMIEAYPLTNALVNKIAENSVEELAYKERWSDKERMELIEKRRNELKKLMNGQTCFALGIAGKKADVDELKYWYGSLEQEGKEYALKLRYDSSEALAATYAWEQKAQKFSAMELYGRLANRREVIGCAAMKLDPTRSFKLVFEPRFNRDILKAELKWIAPRRQVVQE